MSFGNKHHKLALEKLHTAAAVATTTHVHFFSQLAMKQFPGCPK
jgi:hypothetical protein